jgi:hypothetical protein
MTTAHEQQSVELTTKDVQQVLAELGDSVPAEVWRFARALKNSQLTSGKIPVISGQDTRISRGPSGLALRAWPFGPWSLDIFLCVFPIARRAKTE